MDFERWLHVLPLRWRLLSGARQLDRDLDEEIAYHFEQQVEELVGRGIDRDEAWRTVRRNVGGVEQANQGCRDARGMSTIDAAWQEVRHAVRTLRRASRLHRRRHAHARARDRRHHRRLQPDRSDPAVGSSLRCTRSADQYHRTLPERCVRRDSQRARDHGRRPYADGHFFTLIGRGTAVRLAGTRVSAELFSILGVTLAMGRWLRAGEDASPNDRFAILSSGAWRTRFGSDPAILGTSIELDGQPHEVVAVVPASFEFHRGARRCGCPRARSAQYGSQLGWRFHADRRPTAPRSKPG